MLEKVKEKIFQLVTLGVTVSILLSSCSKKEETKREVGYEVVKAVDGSDISVLYPYLLDKTQFEHDELEFSPIYDSTLDFCTVSNTTEYGTNKTNKMTSGTYREIYDKLLVWPNKYKSVKILSSNCYDYELIIEELSASYDTSDIKVVKFKVTAKRDITRRQDFDLTQHSIKKGEYLASTSIWYRDKLVAFKQRGVGSDTEEVQAATIGDVDKALQSVSTLGINGVLQITQEELIDMRNDMNMERFNEYEQKLTRNKNTEEN